MPSFFFLHFIRAAAVPPKERLTFSSRGFSQIEVVVSTLIVGVVLVASLNALGAAQQNQRRAANRLAGPELAYQLMSEVLALSFDDPDSPGELLGIDAGEPNVTRAEFDDLDDYHLWTSTPPAAKDGTSLVGFSDWTRAVVVDYLDPSGGTVQADPTEVKRVRVTVTAPDGVQTSIFAIRSKGGALEQDPAIDSNVVSSLEARLQLGANSQPAVSHAYLSNHAHDAQ